MTFDVWPGIASGSPAPSPSPTTPSGPLITDQLGIETFLILLAVLVFSYALGVLTLHVVSAWRKHLARRKYRREHYDSRY